LCNNSLRGGHMDRYQLRRVIPSLLKGVGGILLILLMALAVACKREQFPYEGDLHLDRYSWLKERKIFLDPGHGGTGKADLFRMGPHGITEEEVNLRVGLYLYTMLQRAGARVAMSRLEDVNISLRERVKMVNEFQPDLLISIHHNGSPRRADGVNYPAVLFWGSKLNRPLSYDFAQLLLNEFHRIMDERGHILSDFSVFPETGTMILRKTRYTCPGVIGEAGFFSDERHARRLQDRHYNQLEAEAYFLAIAEFFKRGLPSAMVYFSCTIERDGILENMITDTKPVIAIETDAGSEDAAVDTKSLRVTIDGLPVGYQFVNDTLCVLRYGGELFPGGHSLRFSFKNSLNQHSMIYRAPFTIAIQRGDYERLVKSGLRLVKRRRTVRKGLRMLLAALSMGLTDPNADELQWHIARGFSRIGDRQTAWYYYNRLYHFYPGSRYAERVRSFGGRMTVEYLGKRLEINSDPSKEEYRNR